jgi:hypothetical protein
MQIKFWLDGKFWTAVVDMVVSLALYFVGKYGAPGLLDDMKIVITAIQPIAASIILAIFQTQQAILTAGTRPSFMAKK